MKSITFWEDLRERKLRQQAALLAHKATLTQRLRFGPPRLWRKWQGRWHLRRPILRRLHERHQRSASKVARINRSLERIHQSLLYIDERIAARRTVWDHVMAGGKDARREALRRAG